MRIFLIILISLNLLSCSFSKKKGIKNIKEPENYTEETIMEFEQMESPVILFGKSGDGNLYNVTVSDANGKIKCFTHFSKFANNIGNSYEVGDTLK